MQSAREDHLWGNVADRWADQFAELSEAPQDLLLSLYRYLSMNLKRVIEGSYDAKHVVLEHDRGV